MTIIMKNYLKYVVYVYANKIKMKYLWKYVNAQEVYNIFIKIVFYNG
jgi:hypothetical protein